MHIRLTELDGRQVLLGGVALLLILVHMIWPGAGVDAVSLILLGFLALVLYGDEATSWLARAQEARLSAETTDRRPESELAERIRDVSYHVEHARVAAATDGIGDVAPIGGSLRDILERAGGRPRPALLLVWGALEDRLRSAGEAPDGLTSARRLAEQGRVPQQFVDAYASFRSLRNDMARGGATGVNDEMLWSLLDVGGALLALAPKPRAEPSWSSD